MERFDVAIVGGGPAGMAAGEQAGTHGASAVVLEQGVPREDREFLGPDSTDAAGMLDYWVDIMDEDYREIPDHVVLQELDGVDFLGPSESATLRGTGIDSSYPGMGFTFNRARMDDWLRERVEDAGTEYRVGVGVKRAETDLDAEYRHTLRLADGEDIEAKYLVLADGPQRRVTLGTLDQFMPEGSSVSDYLSPPTANHIAYQEYREFPEEVFEKSMLKFWWGVIPGETAYPWVFPNDGTVARVGLTMPIGMTLDDVEDPESYALLRPDDEGIPRAGEYIRRLLEREYGDEYDIENGLPARGGPRQVEGHRNLPHLLDAAHRLARRSGHRRRRRRDGHDQRVPRGRLPRRGSVGENRRGTRRDRRHRIVQRRVEGRHRPGTPAQHRVRRHRRGVRPGRLGQDVFHGGQPPRRGRQGPLNKYVVLLRRPRRETRRRYKKAKFGYRKGYVQVANPLRRLTARFVSSRSLPRYSPLSPRFLTLSVSPRSVLTSPPNPKGPYPASVYRSVRTLVPAGVIPLRER